MSVKKDTLSIALQYPQAFFSEIIDASSSLRQSRFNNVSEFARKVRFPRFNRKNIFRILLPVILIIVVLLGLRQALNRDYYIRGTNISVTDAKPVATMTINREFLFPLRDQKGKVVSKLSYNIQTAELRKQIIVKGKRASAVSGRIFLIINLKIVNDLNQGLQVNSRDYIRIIINGNTKDLFAPDIHNDPVEVQAISTKNTRVGLAINESDKNIELRIGGINGPKEGIKLNF